MFFIIFGAKIKDMYIGIFRLILIILSSMVAGMNIFNIMSARANEQSIQVPLITLVGMLVVMLAMLANQYLQKQRTKRDK